MGGEPVPEERVTVEDVVIHYDVPVPMPDGVVLSADVFRPAGRGRHPVLLVRTPYGKHAVPVSLYGRFDVLAAVRAGYAVVIQDTRGSFASQGRFTPFADEAADGEASILWAAAQEWSDSDVCMAGGSYLGATQLLAATRAPGPLKAIAPMITSSECYDGWLYQGGAFQLGFALTWATAAARAGLLRREARGEDVAREKAAIAAIAAEPFAALRRLPLAAWADTPALGFYGEWLRHPTRDEHWQATAVNERYGAIDVPALHIAGWHDIFLKGSLENYAGLAAGAASEHARANQRLIVSPWGHATPAEAVGDLWFGPAASPLALDVTALHLGFFDQVLTRTPSGEAPPVRLFVMGANRWRDEPTWPLARAVPTRYHLRAGGALSREAPGLEAPDEFRYDPRDPVPTVGGPTLIPGDGRFMGPRDRRAVERRTDVLVYTSDVLTRPVEVTGPLVATLWVATSARDTDFTVALVDVFPDGRAIGVADGILRLRCRNGLATSELAEPGRPYEIDVDLVATSNVFLAGHRIRVEVSSSNFPRFDRNPNHGGVISEATERDFVVAAQRVFHDADRASCITLPIVPHDGSVPAAAAS